MADVAVGDIFAMKYHGTVLGQKVQYGVTYRVLAQSAGPTALFTFQNAMADYFANAATGAQLATNWQAMMPTGYKWDKCTVQKIFPTRVPYSEFLIGTTGSGGTGPRTANVCATYTVAGAVSGRKNMAKMHPGPLSDSSWGDGVLTTLGQVRLAALAAAHVFTETVTVAGNDLDVEPVIFHRQIAANPRYISASLFRLNGVVRTLRHRTIGVGK